jgi:endoglucanase
MKKKMQNQKLFTIVFLIAASIQCGRAQVPFSRGVNLTNWFQASSAQEIQFTKFTKQDFINIKSLGFDVIRLPINLHAMTSGSPDYIIEPLFFSFLDSAVTWAEELQIHLLLDNHTFDPAANTDPEIGPVLVKVWTQMAEHYKNRSGYIYYEILNEPHGILDQLWGQIQQSAIDAIREIDSIHTIIVGPAGWNSYNNLNAMPRYSDTNLIYTFHFYDPFMFTHQGASWTDPSMVPLSGVPFPYDPVTMPSCPPELTGTWIESSLNNYANDGTIDRVKGLLGLAVSFRDNRDVPLFCGEFGVYIPNSEDSDRVFWYKTVSDYLELNGIPWTMWDYTGGFGLFEKGSPEMFEYDLNIPLVEALGLNVPEQKEFVIEPDSTGFDIYFEYIAEKISSSSWAGNGIINYYNTQDPFAGNYSMKWSDGDQYNFVGFDFKPDKDISYLVENGYVINFSIRGNIPGAKFDIRFLDTKTSEPGDHPWRMRYTMTDNIAPWDGEWHPVSIPLSSFTEHGSWDNNTWYNPVGAFDWTAIDRFEIVAEQSSMNGVEFDFDNLRVTDAPLSVISKRRINEDAGLITIYPNPVSQEMGILYKVEEDGPIEISIFDITGQKIAMLVNEKRTSGDYTLILNIRDIDGIALPAGVYFCRIAEARKVQTEKIIVTTE